MFLLRCPRCKNKMKYHGRSMILFNKRKKCVYCGHTFKVREQILKKE